ncbi:MAG: MBL fold metallo-hydrolase [Candidatus Aminicenantes bacterium]|nr:MBL fold metallo-hydrolase [Candidatus Aminicenantes bacterium]
MTCRGRSLRLGKVEITCLTDGEILVDAAAMFGDVPRGVWTEAHPPDGQNRVPLALHSFLVRTPDAVVLTDTGVGEALDPRYAKAYSLRREKSLIAGLAEAGCRPEDVNLVVNTHLHFDHCGWNTVRTPAHGIGPAFPRARYVIQRGEWEVALRPKGPDKPSYRPLWQRPLAAAGVLDLLEGGREIAPGVEVIPLPGHTVHHQGVKVTSDAGVFVSSGDSIPTAAHAGLETTMSFDLDPVEASASKKRLLELAAAEDWILSFGHDPLHPFGRVRRNGLGYAAVYL